jgi:hypothetical protein
MDNQRELISKINEASNLIHKTSRRGYGNSYIVVSKLLYDTIFGEDINIIRIRKINKLWNRS